jgi:predicted ArsR family transcriptional regulator
MVKQLRWSGRTVEELARALGLTDNGVRVHLAVLERDALCGSEVRYAVAAAPASRHTCTS